MIKLHPEWTDRQAWDDFVRLHPEGRFSQTSCYEGSVKVYGFQYHLVGFTLQDRLVAVAPICEIKPRKLISQAFSEYGGLLVDPELSTEQGRTVLKLLQDHLSQRFPGAVLEIHGNHGTPPTQRDGLVTPRNPHFLAYLPLRNDVETTWKKVIRYEVRKAVNKARRSGVEIEDVCDEETIRRDFFPLYLVSMKRLGAPPHSIDYYLQVMDGFGEEMKIFWASYEGKRISGLLGFTCGNRVSIINIVSNPAYWHLRPNDLLHWAFIEFAIINGYEYFDFGSVRYEGQNHYKRKWGCDLMPHQYEFIQGQGQLQTIQTFDSSSGFMTKAADLWSRFMPLPATRYLGPPIRRLLAR